MPKLGEGEEARAVLHAAARSLPQRRVPGCCGEFHRGPELRSGGVRTPTSPACALSGAWPAGRSCKRRGLRAECRRMSFSKYTFYNSLHLMLISVYVRTTIVISCKRFHRFRSPGRRAARPPSGGRDEDPATRKNIQNIVDNTKTLI